MGNYSSQETTNIVSEFITAINSTVVNIANSSIAKCSTIQSIMVDNTDCTFPFYGPGVEFNFSQNSNSNCSINSENFNSVSGTLNTDIKNTIKNFTKEKIDQGNGWLATGFNISGSTITNQDQLNEQLENLFNVDIKNTCQSSIVSLQQGVFKLCGNYQNAKIDLAQDAVSGAFVSCINTNMVTSFESNSILNDFVNNTDIAVAQKNAGLFDILIYAVIAFAVVSIVGAIAYYYFQGGQTSPEERRRREEAGYGERPAPYGQRPPGYGGPARYAEEVMF